MTNGILLFLNMGPGEMLLIVAVILIFFGSKNIPKIANTLGKGMREFKTASDEIRREIRESGTDEEIKGQINEFKEHMDIRKEIENNNPK